MRADATFPEVAGGLVISADRGRVRRFGPDGREGGGVLYGQEFLGPIHRWDVAGGEPLSPLPTGAEGMSEGGLAADEDGRVLISVGQSGAVWRWDLTVPEPRAQLLGADQDAAPAVVPSGSGPLALFRSGVTVAGVRLPDKQLIVATGGDEGIERYDVLEDRRRESSPTGATVWTVTSGVWPDGRPFFAAGTADGRVHLVDARAGARMRRAWPVPEQDVLAVAVTALSDGSLLLATGGHDRRITRWNAVTGERLGPPSEAGEYAVMELHLRTLPDGRTVPAVGRRDGSLTVVASPFVTRSSQAGAFHSGSRPMKPSNLVWASASSFTGTRGPYCPEDRISCSMGSMPATSRAQSSGSSRSSWPVARARSHACMKTSVV